MASLLRIVLADDDPRVRSALRLLVEQSSELQVAGEVDTARELPALVRQLRPAVLFLDWDQPGLDRVGALTALRVISPSLAVVALGTPEDRAGALAAGADYFLAKSDPPDILLACLGSLASRHGHNTSTAA